MSKKIKALLAVVLCAAMLVAAASPAFAAVDNNDVLRFNKDGSSRSCRFPTRRISTYREKP